MADQREEVRIAAASIGDFMVALFDEALRIGMVAATGEAPVSSRVAAMIFSGMIFVRMISAGVIHVAGVSRAVIGGGVISGAVVVLIALHRLSSANVVNSHVEKAMAAVATASVAVVIRSVMFIVSWVANSHGGDSIQGCSQRHSLQDALFQVSWGRAIIHALGFAHSVDWIDQAKSPWTKRNSYSNLQHDGGNPQKPGDFTGCPRCPKKAGDAQHRNVAACSSHGCKCRGKRPRLWRGTASGKSVES
mmetsp:Transcript_28174/g.52836  ORF Transcript_28174/g.52836 Transcript_28174/m.52836 type:complete len:248 (+) Transcript_28174:1328-2071(+)